MRGAPVLEGKEVRWIMEEKKKAQLEQWLLESRVTVFFGGAGVSTESGIPDFRSQDGLYRTQYRYPPEQIISHSFFMQNPEEFFAFYRNKMIFPSAVPNAAHRRLAALEAQGKLKAVITKNIDGLHQLAGSRKVLELHGSVHRNYCTRCGREYDLSFVLETEGVPRCACGAIVRPDVVLYEEALNAETMDRAVEYIAGAEMLIVGGTSLSVYPAAGLLHYYRGNRLVLINRTETAYSTRANLEFREPIGTVLAEQ